MVADILCEFLEVAIHLILYVREVYPSGIFQKRKKYNVPVQVQDFLIRTYSNLTVVCRWFFCDVTVCGGCFLDVMSSRVESVYPGHTSLCKATHWKGERTPCYSWGYLEKITYFGTIFNPSFCPQNDAEKVVVVIMDKEHHPVERFVFEISQPPLLSIRFPTLSYISFECTFMFSTITQPVFLFLYVFSGWSRSQTACCFGLTALTRYCHMWSSCWGPSSWR